MDYQLFLVFDLFFSDQVSYETKKNQTITYFMVLLIFFVTHVKNQKNTNEINRLSIVLRILFIFILDQAS